MGVLDYPRIHFRGTATANPATADNDDVALEIDTTQVALNPNLAAMTNVQARSWLTGGLYATNPFNQNTYWYVRGGWNYYGDLTTEFASIAVCSTVDTRGKFVDQDPLIGRLVSLHGSPTKNPEGSLPKLCDVDPLGTAMSQLFLGGFTLGDEDVGVSAVWDTRALSRWVGFRNAAMLPGEELFQGGGAVWQFAVPANALIFHGAEHSRTLSDLEVAAGENLGILVQFAMYQFAPKISGIDMILRFQNGEVLTNPAEGLVVGTVGVWKRGDLRSFPDGRLLLPAPYATLGATALAKKLGFDAYYLGPAAARVHTQRPLVSLNLITTFPEDGYDPPLTKGDFGTVRIGYVPPAGAPPVAISAPIDYDYTTYEQTGGILDVPYDPDIVDPKTLADCDLVLLAEVDGTGQLVSLVSEERSSVTVEIDRAAVYLEVGETQDIEVRVRERGKPPLQDVTLYLWEFQYVTQLSGALDRPISILRQVGGNEPLINRLDFPAQIIVPAHDSAPTAVAVIGRAAGGATLAFTTTPQPPDGPFPWETAQYASFRVLPDDDFSQVPPAIRTSWHFIYHTIFRYYDLIFPAMSQIIPFDDRSAMEAHADALVARTDPKLWHSTLYMPVTRDLSPGKRALLVEWADQVRRRMGRSR